MGRNEEVPVQQSQGQISSNWNSQLRVDYKGVKMRLHGSTRLMP